MIRLRKSARALLRNDLRKLSRDPVLLASAIVPLLLGLLLRFGLPALESLVADQFDLAAHRPVITAGALVITAMLGGWIVGFMLLEERAQRMIPALSVTPLTRRGFVAWRLLSPTIIALLGGLFVILLAAPGTLELGPALAACGLMALSAPLFALALVGVADNEVEGLALAKLGALAFMLPLVTVYLDPSQAGAWVWVAGLLPPFWPIQLMLGGPWWTALAGLGVAGLWAVLLLRRLARRIE